jgi:L-lactate dehydrogenase (cytochrome)
MPAHIHRSPQRTSAAILEHRYWKRAPPGSCRAIPELDVFSAPQKGPAMQNTTYDDLPAVLPPTREAPALGLLASVSDMRRAARAMLPEFLFDLLDGGAFEERTLQANCRDFDNLYFRPRVLSDVSRRSTASTILGQPAAFPLVVAPTGMTSVYRGCNGETTVAGAARAAGIPYCLSMMSFRSVEEVHAATGTVWQQIAMLKDRGLMLSLIERAKATACPVLVLTTTWPIPSQLNRMVRAGMTRVPPPLTWRTLLALACRPRWVWQVLLRSRPILPEYHNFSGPLCHDLGSIVEQLNPAATWRDVEWLRTVWPGKLLLKGITAEEDIEAAVGSGVDAISVSNHGGNMLDGAASSISALPEVVDSVKGRMEVLMDGGIRSGQDILKALALGARACMVGRAPLYGLAAHGAPGVAKVFDMLRHEFDVSMALTGLSDVRHASRSLLWD